MILTAGKQTSVYDPTLVQIQDVNSNFYISESHAGKVSRAEAAIGQLKELNPYMEVDVVKGPINNDLLKKYSLVIVTELIIPMADLIKANEFCRSQKTPIGFIMTLNMGLYGCSFVDFGPKFMVKDATGESPRSYIVVNITKDNPGIVYLHDIKKHDFNDGDYVKFKEVEGMDELNSMEPIKIKVIDKFSFSIVDTTKFKNYIKGGIVENVKMPVEVKFKSLKESLENPLQSKSDFLINADLRLFGRAEQLHIGLCAIFKYHEKNKSLPELNNLAQANEVVKLAVEVNEEHKKNKTFTVEKVEEEVVRNFALYSRAEITTMCSFFGGIAAQEGFKIVGKYNPLCQWLHYDCFESLPTSKVNRTPMKSRYDDFIAIYGQELLTKIQNLKLLMIGAGALGCELVKAFALLGITTNTGSLTLTDNDNIELSNLSRQFLFRQKDVGQPKSLIAGNVATKTNPKFHVKSLTDFVAPTTEHIFTEDFWDDLDMVIGAVDNIKARMYIDGKCVWHGKPFIDSGTLGTKANTQIILPKLTQSYTDSVDPEEESFPMCTIRNFPNLIEHTIEWGRSQFEGMFTETPRNVSDYVKDSDSFIKRILGSTTITGAINTLKNVRDLIQLKKLNSFDACIKFAREQFEEHFNKTIGQLLFTFPPDYKDEHGTPFWTGPKRAPKVIEFNPKDPLHALYVQSCSIIMAGVLKMKLKKEQCEQSYIMNIAAKVAPPKFVPTKVKVVTDEKESVPEEDVGDKEKEEFAHLKEELKKIGSGLKDTDFEPVDFEKDDDSNFHVDCIHSAANLRARNYKIAECDKLKTRGIAGRIIPAIATTTAMIVGCVCNEILKVALKVDKIELYKTAFVNLALPMFVFSEPPPAIEIKTRENDPIMLGKVTSVPEGHTKWGRIDAQGPLTYGELVKKIENEYKVKLNLCICNGATIYMEPSSNTKRLNMKIEDIYEEVTKAKLDKSVKSLRLEVAGDVIADDSYAELPNVKYILKKH